VSREKTNITKPVYRYRTDAGFPTCVWSWDDDEICEHYMEHTSRCGWCEVGLVVVEDGDDEGRVIPCDGCPLWLPEVEVIP